jgi:phosphatidate phosphatase PAH1
VPHFLPRFPLLLTAVAACTPADDPAGDTDTDVAATSCHLVVTDIDETLTTADSEWILQLGDASHDPAMRPDADTLMQSYADKGFGVVYVTARGEDLTLSDGSSARDATVGWLEDHGFPVDEADVYLADGAGALGDAAVGYKAGVIQGLLDRGDVVDWAYGNAESDIEAYQQEAIPDDHVFLVGKLAGQMGVEPVPDADAYTSHEASQLPLVAEVDACGL